MTMPQWFIAIPLNLTLVVCMLLYICPWTKVSSILSLARWFQDNDTNEEITKERALSIFEDVLDHSKANDTVDVATSGYRSRFNNHTRFSLSSNYFSVEVAFWKASRILAMTRERALLDIAQFWAWSEGGCPRSNRMCAQPSIVEGYSGSRLEIFGATGMSTHKATFYLDVCIWLHWNGHILNFHLLSILTFSSNAVEQIFF